MVNVLTSRARPICRSAMVCIPNMGDAAAPEVF